VRTIETYLNANDPVKRGESVRVVVTADPVPPMRSDGSYRVTYTARSYDLDSQLLRTDKYAAVFGLRWGEPTPVFEKAADGEIVGGNPVGMYVCAITPEQALNTRASGAGP